MGIGPDILGKSAPASLSSAKGVRGTLSAGAGSGAGGATPSHEGEGIAGLEREGVSREIGRVPSSLIRRGWNAVIGSGKFGAKLSGSFHCSAIAAASFGPDLCGISTRAGPSMGLVGGAGGVAAAAARFSCATIGG